jgi:hypothetical protein
MKKNYSTKLSVCVCVCVFVSVAVTQAETCLRAVALTYTTELNASNQLQ